MENEVLIKLVEFILTQDALSPDDKKKVKPIMKKGSLHDVAVEIVKNNMLSENEIRTYMDKLQAEGGADVKPPIDDM